MLLEHLWFHCLHMSAHSSLQFVQMCQSSQYNRFASLFDLAGKKDLIEDSIHLRFRKPLPTYRPWNLAEHATCYLPCRN